MASTISIKDILVFHKLDRRFYVKLVSLGTAPAVARHVVALFMWLELLGVDVIPRMYNQQDDCMFLRMAAEAEAILKCIREDRAPDDTSYLAVPFVSSLVGEPLNLSVFYWHRDVAVKGITNVLDGVGALIFDDSLYALLAVYEAEVKLAVEEAAMLLMAVELPELPQDLSDPYVPHPAPGPEDCRSMFVTFSKGLPLRREDISDYFLQKWGNCVERVMMEKTTGGATPMYGRIVFTSESYVELVLHGRRLAKLLIKGRQLWARKYVPRRYNIFQSN